MNQQVMHCITCSCTTHAHTGRCCKDGCCISHAMLWVSGLILPTANTPEKAVVATLILASSLLVTLSPYLFPHSPPLSSYLSLPLSTSTGLPCDTVLYSSLPYLLSCSLPDTYTTRPPSLFSTSLFSPFLALPHLVPYHLPFIC